MADYRVQSLTIISSTAGGWQILPNTWRGLKMAVQMVMARTPEDAVDVTLRVHFTKRTLKEWVSGERVIVDKQRALLYAQPPFTIFSSTAGS